MSRTKNEKPKELSQIQIEKISRTIIGFAERTNNNAIVTMLAGKLKPADTETRRKWIVTVYAQAFQLLSLVGMARDDKRTIEEYQDELKKLFASAAK